MNMKRLLTLVAFFATVQASAQQVNPVPDYVFANRMSAGRNTVTDTAAYFSIGPRYGATRGMMPPMVVDTSSFSGNKRNGLLIFSVQKNKFLYWDSVGVKWAEMAGTGGSAITGSGVAGYMPEFTTTTNLDTTRLYHSSGRFAIGSTTTTNGVFNVYGGQSYFDTSLKVGASTLFADESKDEVYVGTTADSGSYALQVNGKVFSNNAFYLSGQRKYEITASESSSLEIISRNPNYRLIVFDTSLNIALGALTSSSGATPTLWINGSEKEIFVNNSVDAGAFALQVTGTTYISGETLLATTSDAGDYKLQIAGNIYNTSGGALAATSGELYVGGTSDAGDYKLQVIGNLYNTGGVVLAATGGEVLVGTTTDRGAFKFQADGISFFGSDANSYALLNNTASSTAIQAYGAWTNHFRMTYPAVVDFDMQVTASGELDVKRSSNVATRINSSLEFLINTTTDAGTYQLQVSGNIYNTGSVTTGAPSGGSIKPWKLGEAATVSPTSPNRTIRVEIDGTVYYLHAKTTND